MNKNDIITLKIEDMGIDGEGIGNVGPKNVYGVKGNQYKDENR